jgi:hypothetical protein
MNATVTLARTGVPSTRLTLFKLPRRAMSVSVQAQSEYGLEMPTKRVDPVVPNTTPEQNKASAKAWIEAWRASKASAGGLQPGQGTAIWTGAVSIILGLAYFALTIVLDSRGDTMLPPPPEAFLP